MAISYPKYGAEGGFIKTTKAERAEQAELQMGAHAEVLIKSTTTECSATKSDCSWGIEPSDNVIFDSIRFSVEDELDPKFTAAQTSSIDPTKSLVKVLNGCCLIKRAKGTLTISGKGDPGWTIGSTTIPTSMVPAIATGTPVDLATTITGLSGLVLRCQSYTVNASDTDWQNFSAEYIGYIDGDPTTGKSIAKDLSNLTPPNCTCTDTAEGGTNGCCDTYKYEVTLNGTGYGETSITKTSHEYAAPSS